MVRQITALYEKHRDVYTEGKMKPLYSIHGRNVAGRCLVTPGHYLIANGGVDTLATLEEAYRIARWASKQDHDVLMEGKNMSDGVKHVNELVADGFDVRVVVINTDVPLAIKSVRERGHKIAEASIERTYHKVMRDATGFHCETLIGDRMSCLDQLMRIFNVGERRNGTG
jgi:hypothetical protein